VRPGDLEIKPIPRPRRIGPARGGHRSRRYGPQEAGHLGGDQCGKGVKVLPTRFVLLFSVETGLEDEPGTRPVAPRTRVLPTRSNPNQLFAAEVLSGGGRGLSVTPAVRGDSTVLKPLLKPVCDPPSVGHVLLYSSRDALFAIY
jgi:hypothetical protein